MAAATPPSRRVPTAGEKISRAVFQSVPTACPTCKTPQIPRSRALGLRPRRAPLGRGAIPSTQARPLQRSGARPGFAAVRGPAAAAGYPGRPHRHDADAGVISVSNRTRDWRRGFDRHWTVSGDATAACGRPLVDASLPSPPRCDPVTAPPAQPPRIPQQASVRLTDSKAWAAQGHERRAPPRPPGLSCKGPVLRGTLPASTPTGSPFPPRGHESGTRRAARG